MLVAPLLSLATYLKLSGPTYPVLGVYRTVFCEVIVPNVPCVGLATILNVIGSLSGSFPVRVMSTGVLIFVVILIESAVGCWLVEPPPEVGPITNATSLPSELGTTAGSVFSLRVPPSDVQVEDQVVLPAVVCVL